MDHSQLIKIFFIYNAILNGWTVKLLSNNKFKFFRSKNKDIILNEFINKNLNFNQLLA